VAAIKEGCELYKQAKESFMEVKSTVDEAVGVYREVTGFWSNFSNFFKPKAKQSTPKPVAKKKEKFVAVDETQVKVDIVKNLTEFFRLQEQLAAHIREEEEKSLTVYDPDQNHMEAALKRVMAQQEMDALVVQIRECMVYQSPPEMGALYSEVFSMKDKIDEEQTQARLKQEAIKRQEAWLRKEEERNLQAKLAAVVATFIFLLYLWMWFVFVSHWGKK
jgi:uncharacterized protein YdaU (DUF1376 family)